jgi:hypothetical protein
MIINLPKLGPVNFRDDLTPEQFQSELGRLQEKYDFKLPKPDVGIGTLLKRGFMRGVGETGIALGDVLPAMGASALGFDEYAQRQMGEAQESRAALEAKYPTQFKSYTEIGSPYEALQYGAETLGELGPTALTAMVPGAGASALGSRVAARGAMGAALEAGPLSRAGLAAAETAAAKAGEVAGKRAMYGGVYLGSFAQNAPEVFEGIYQETDKMEPGIAALAGGISSVLDAIVPAKVLGELGGYGKMKVIEKLAKESGAAPKVWKYIGKEAAMTAGSEGLTEAAQEAINVAAEQIVGATKGMLDPESIQRYKESFVKGAIGGSAFGTVSGTSQGLTARKDYRDTQEAETALQAQYDAEKAAGTLTPEKQAEYDIALENARKQRESDLAMAFRNTRESEMARMDQIRPAEGYMPDAETQAEIDKMEADRAKALEEQQKADAEIIQARYGERGAPFSIVPPTSGTGGLYSPALEQQRADQQQATRDFAFGPVATNTPGDPVTVDTLKNLKVSDRSKVGLQLLGTDLDTVDGRRTFIQTLENPEFMGNIDPAAYDDIVSTFDPEEVKAHRAEMQTVDISPTKQKQQEQTRQFAFGVPDVTRPDTTPSGGSPSVVSQPASIESAATDTTPERGGDVLTQPDVGGATGGEGQQSPALTYKEAEVEDSNGKKLPGLYQQFSVSPTQSGSLTLGIKDGRLFPTYVENGGVEGTGAVTQAYKDAIDEAEKRGLQFTSDNSVTTEAARIYDRLQEAGYEVTKNPSARLAESPEVVTPRLVTDNGAPVFTVRKKTDGTTTTQTQQAEAQGQAATATARSVLDRPDFSAELPAIQQKLGGLKNKLDQVAKDARAYFGKVVPELALDSIANDLVYQPTAYRNSNMKLPSVLTPGAFALTPEPTFGTKEEAAFFLGQGGIHAKNAEAWARANLSPESVAFMDQKIAQYTKEKKRSDAIRRRQESQTTLRKATKTQVAEEAAAAEAEGEYAPTEEEIAEAKGTKTEAGKRKAQMQRLAKQLSNEDPYSDLDDIADTDISGLMADADLAALHTQAHPVVLNQLANNNLVGALQALADSGSSKTAELFAQNLSKLVGNVKLVYGAEKSMYDPKTNTVYLRDGATEYEILHESSHATMSHTLDNPSHPVTRQVTNLFNQMKKGTEGTYGATDVQEFAAEAWSNDAFRNHLKQFKPTGERLTGWERLVNAMRQLLRLPPKHETALDAIDRMLNDIISPPPATRTGETMYAQSLHNPNVVQEMFTKMGDTIRKQPLMNKESAVGFWKGAEKIGTTGRQLMYKALNLSALGEVGSKYLGSSATRFASTVEEMAGYQEKMLEAMSPLHKRLTEFRQTPEYQAWSTLVHDATTVDVRPYKEAKKLYDGSPEKEAEWKQLNARFEKLTPNGQKLYRDLFATYKALDTEFLKSLERNIEATVGDKAKSASAYQKILQELASVRIDHYAPLFREGQFWLQYNVGKEVKKEAFETEADRDFARKKLEASGITKFDAYSRADQITAKNVPSGTMLADIMKIMKDNGAGEDAINDLIQLVVKAMPEASILKSRQKRTGIGGYVDNAAYVFDHVSSNTARQLARMQYGPELQRLVKDMVETANQARGDANTFGIELINEFEGRRKFAMQPTVAGWAQFASSSAFYYNLAGNVSSALVNTLQTPLIVFPQLGGEYGFKESYAALKNAMKLYTSSGLTKNVTELTGDVSSQKAMTSIENWVNKGKYTQYKGLIDAMKDRGLLVTSTARDALRSENDNSSGYGSTNKLARVTTLVGSFMFHHAERMNREITAVAAFDLEMAKLKNSKMSEAEKQAKAIDKALALVEYTHGAGSTLSGPSLGQSDVGKVLMVFKRFAFSMYYMLFDTMMRSLPVKGATGEQLEAIKAARRQLTGVYGMSALFAGVKGMPLYWIAEAAYNMFQGDDDDDFDTVMRGFIGDFAFKGPVNYLTNLSIADRVGWTDLLWREQKGSKADASALSQFMETLLGAPYSIADSILRGKDLIAEGQYERGIEAMLPIGMRNILKGGRYAIEGANTLRGDAVGDVNGYNAAMQVLGFAPADLMKAYEENAYMTEKSKAIKAIEKNALKKYYAAMREGDIDGMLDAREKLFNLAIKYPELKISEKTITQSVKARERISAEMHNGVQLDRKLAPYLKQAAAEAYGD